MQIHMENTITCDYSFMTHIRVRNNYSLRAERSDGTPCVADIMFCLTSAAFSLTKIS